MALGLPALISKSVLGYLQWELKNTMIFTVFLNISGLCQIHEGQATSLTVGLVTAALPGLE